MKRMLIVLFVLLLCLAPIADAETPFDLSGMSYEELVALKDQINLAMWNSQEWQEVIVPQGVWKVGEDIPAGHWTISALSANTTVKYGTKLDKSGKDISYKSEFSYSQMMHNPESVVHFEPNYDVSQIDLELIEGAYVIVKGGKVAFTPYQGKPDLGFK